MSRSKRTNSVEDEIQRLLRPLERRAEQMADDQGRLSVPQFRVLVDVIVQVFQAITPRSEWPRVGAELRKIFAAETHPRTAAAVVYSATQVLVGEEKH